MKRLCYLAIFFLFYGSISAQRSFGTIVLGVESGFDVAQFTSGLKPSMIPALQLEGSLGPVSLGIGIGRKQYREFEFYSFTGETTQREVNGALQTFYLADLHAFKPAYWIVPLKINYRVHRCDCVYLHAGITFEKVDLGRPDIIKFRNAEFNQPYAVGVQRGQLVVPKTKTYEFGIGFNVYKRDFFRLTARPAYVLTENPEVDYTANQRAPKYLPTLRFTFAAQFALWRQQEAD